MPAPFFLLIGFDGPGSSATGTLAAAASPAVAAYGVANVPPPATATLGAAAGPAVSSYGAFNAAAGVTLLWVGVEVGPAVAAYGLDSVPPAATVTYGAAAGPAAPTYLFTTQLVTATYGAVAQAAPATYRVRPGVAHAVGNPIVLLLERRRRRTPVTPEPVPPDLVAAVIAQLRATPAVVAAFGDGAATPKFFSQVAVGSPDPPYLVIDEPMESREWMSGGSFKDDGQLDLSVYGTQSKLVTRQLGDSVSLALNDAPLVFEGRQLMKFRWGNARFVNTGDVGVGAPTTYQRFVSFSYMCRGPFVL